MQTTEMSRRVFAGMIAGAAVSAAGGWIELFDGHDLQGGSSAGKQAAFQNFELEIEALARPGCDSRVSLQPGFEIQIGNSERQKTGSLFGLRNVYKQLVRDDEWFTIQAAVRGQNLQVAVNGTLVVDYTHERRLAKPAFALEHKGSSKAVLRSFRVRPLADDIATPGPAPVVDETYRQIIAASRGNIPMIDYHVHLKGDLTLERALGKSRLDGIAYGLAVNCGRNFPVQNDEGARRFVGGLRGQPAFIAMQAEGREWTGMFSRQTLALFDYVFTDSMTWTDNRGRRMRLWIPEEVGTIADPQEFMETLVARTVGILEAEPVNIYVNPTFLPDCIAKDYDRLWTEERMGKVVEAARKSGIAIELNNRYKLPSPAFIRMAKTAGCKFAFGSNNATAADLGRCEYGLAMVEQCRLSWPDFFVPR